MIDFLKISSRHTKKDTVEIFPKFIVNNKSKDLMIRGSDFYAIWLEDKGVWSKEEQDAIELIDKEIEKYAREHYGDDYSKAPYGMKIDIKYMWDSGSGVIDLWHKYCQKQSRDNFKPLDETLVFANQEVRKDDYATKRLDYSLEPGSIDAYNELISALYYPEERHKLEWAIGAIVTGASKVLQKFIVLYGGPGTGKSTALNIIQELFEGYYNTFDAKALGSSSDQFALESFKSNPLVAIQHDGDLSHIEDNTRLNSLVSHELMTVNEKHKSLYSTRFISFLFMGTNKPVKITDSKSGILRRLIDVKPTGKKLPVSVYNNLMERIKFELGHIAYHCKEVFEKDPHFYDNYIPTDMMGESNDFFNFVEDSYLTFKRDDKVTLKEAWEMYKTYVDSAKVAYPFSMRVVKSELKTYFNFYSENYYDPDTKQHIRNLYWGFKYQLFESKGTDADEHRIIEPTEEHKVITFKKQKSKLDEYCKDCIAQYATNAEVPGKKWENVTTTLKDLDTSKLHYVKPPTNLIVIDFDLKGPDGKKSYERNLEAANKWPSTYAELSKSGTGIHLHYIYDGDPTLLSRIYDEDIEIKVFTGNASLRRKVIKCSDDEIAHISSGLPLKGLGSKVENIDVIKSERALRTLIRRSLNKEIHGATKPSIDFIYKILEEAYESGLKYDVSDLYNQVLAFAAGSTHQSDYCLNLFTKMKFKSDDNSDSFDDTSKPIVFFDIEVFPNVIFINYKLEGARKMIIRLINPKPQDIEHMIQSYRLVGFNNRRYDNHILYAILIGKTIPEIYQLSQDIVNGNKAAFFGEAYNLSYTDIYDYSSKKQSLKKWEIELGLHHLELGLPWDQPVDEKEWPRVSEYCDNDVISTEAVWEATQDEFTAREILADIAGMSVNDTSNTLTTKIIFGNDKNPELIYTDLSETFPGYQFIKNYDENACKYVKQNMYRGTDLGFGGYVDAIPGMYGNVALLDITSLHPHTIIELNLFGKYTKNYADLVYTRKFIKHKQYDKAKKLFGGKLEKYLIDESHAKKLSNALKIPINSVYGLTSARFSNPFKDPRNENNIVALRGALFMRTLQDEVTSRGFKAIHIKTDSIKIPDATPEIIKFCMEFAKKYGYEFEHEATYDRICLVNDAVYIAKLSTAEQCNNLYGYVPEDNMEKGGKWTATGTQFQIPYVFKKCFSGEPIVFDDMCETKEVKTAMYLDYNENLPIDEHDRKFIGKVGLFCPIKLGCGGAELVKEMAKKDGSVGYDAVVGTKGYRWLEAENIKGIREQDIDIGYYQDLVNDAIDTINHYGDYYWFVSDDPYIPNMWDE